MKVHLVPNGDDLDLVAECHCGWVGLPVTRPQDVDRECPACREVAEGQKQRRWLQRKLAELQHRREAYRVA